MNAVRILCNNLIYSFRQLNKYAHGPQFNMLDSLLNHFNYLGAGIRRLCHGRSLKSLMALVVLKVGFTIFTFWPVCLAIDMIHLPALEIKSP